MDATVVHFCASDPSLHWLKVRKDALEAPRAAEMQGMRHTLPQVRTSAQNAGGTERSAGFSIARGVEDDRQASMADAVKSAR